MNRRSVVVPLAVAAVAALWFLWPTISGSRGPRPATRIDGWVPTEDPGTTLRVSSPGRVEFYALGADHHAVDAACGDQVRCTEIAGMVYREQDGTPGPNAEAPDASFENRPGEPTSSQTMDGQFGYRGGRSLRGKVTYDDGVVSEAIVGAPVQFVARGTTPWQLLAALPNFGVLLEWSQTEEHLLIRRSTLPGAAAPVWGHHGSVQVFDAACQFADDTQVAQLFRARVPQLRSGERNVQVFVDVGDAAEISLRIAVK